MTISNSNTKRILMGLLVLLSVISIAWIYYKSINNNQLPGPSPEPLLFKLTGTYPDNGVGTTIPQTSAIEFLFNKPIEASTLIVTSDPASNLRFEVSDNKRSVFVRNTPYWEIGKNYSISISAYSTEGDLVENYKYNLRIEQLKDSNLIE